MSEKYDHESHCQYREVRCQYEHHGCEVVMTVKVGTDQKIMIMNKAKMTYVSGHVLAQ